MHINGLMKLNTITLII